MHLPRRPNAFARHSRASAARMVQHVTNDFCFPSPWRRPPASKSTGMHKFEARRRAALALALILLLLLPPQPARAYSVLSHEQVVDLAWKSHIVPLLRYRWPEITPEQIKEAHAYAYGGAIIQDIGYYPFGDKLLSDMLHYV